MHSLIINGEEYRFFNARIAVSKQGHVLFMMKPHTPYLREDGYLSIGKQLVHRIVAYCWIDNPSNHKWVHHKNENKSDNRADNLEWLTPKTHIAIKHKDIMGKQSMPESARKKLSDFRKGTVQTEETKEKIRQGAITHFQNPENLDKYRESLKTRNTNRDNSASVEAHKLPCCINDVNYNSVKEAAIALNMKSGTVRVRLLSKNFTAWYYLPK